MRKLLSVGVLRLALASLVLVLIAAAIFADGRVYMHSWRLFPSVIAPSLVAMIVFILPLDITMAWVFKASTDVAKEQQRFGLIIKIDCLLLGLLILAWLPFIFTVLNR